MNSPEKRRKYFLELQKAAALKRMTKREAALLLLVLSGVSGAKKTCDVLTVSLRGESWYWIEDEELLDSALVIFAMYNYRQTEIDGVCLAYFTNKMLANEVEVGGPYYDNKQKIDLLTNFVISKLFKLLGSPLRNVDLFLKKHTFPAFTHGDAAIIYDLLNSSASEKTAVGASRTMPLLAEALAYKKPSKRTRAEATSISQIISENVYKELQNMSRPLKEHATMMWNMINKTDTNHEITMMPAYFSYSLLDPPKSLNQKVYIELGAANFYTWMAYTIYDDIIDEEGRAELLPVASSTLRKALAVYVRLSRRFPSLRREVFESLDKMDGANSWELAHCRYEVSSDRIKAGRLPAYANYQMLADRARGHILGPMTIMYQLQATAAQQVDIQKGLEHFLIAKQLNDDLHDWTSDFQKGHISPVVAYLLKSLKIRPGWHDKLELAKRMQECLWSGGVTEINKIILKHLAYSKRHFKKSTLLDLNGEFFLYIFNPLEESARENELKYIHQQQFLAAYSDDIEKNSD